MRERRACPIRGKRGATLAELLVTFALLSLFLAGAAAVLAPATSVYQHIKYQSYAQNVSDIFLEKICGEISSASSDEMVIDSSGSKISFSDSKASPLYMKVVSGVKPDEGNEGESDAGYLLLHYRTIYYSDDGSKVLWPAVNWKYDLNAYQGFQITGLHFRAVGDAQKSVEVTLTLRHSRFQVEHTATRIVECYNLDSPIETGAVYDDDEDFWAAKTAP